MKKIILSTILVLSIILPSFALTWEGLIDASGNVSGAPDDLSLEQVNRATLSLQVPLNAENTMQFSARAFYELGFATPIPNTIPIELSHLVDAELLKFNMQIPLDDVSLFSLDAGRFPVADLTTIVLNQTSDGVKAAYENEMMRLNTYVGFTGLLNEYTVSMNVAPNDLNLTEFYSLAAPFVLANVTLQLPQLFLNQDLYTGVIAAIDVAEKENKELAPDNRFYATVGLNGPFNNSIFYSLTSTLGVMQATKSTWDITNLSTFELSAFLPFASSLLSWKTVFATGGTNAEFKPFTVNTATLDDSLEYAGHVKTGIVMTLRPLENLLLFVEPNAIFDVMNDSQPGYEGAQWTFATRYNIMSDLQLSASVGQFIPADITSINDSYITADVKLSFLF